MIPTWLLFIDLLVNVADEANATRQQAKINSSFILNLRPFSEVWRNQTISFYT